MGCKSQLNPSSPWHITVLLSAYKSDETASLLYRRIYTFEFILFSNFPNFQSKVNSMFPFFQKRCAHLLLVVWQSTKIKILKDSCCSTLNRSHALNDDTNASRRQFPSEKTTISLSLALVYMYKIPHRSFILTLSSLKEGRRCRSLFEFDTTVLLQVLHMPSRFLMRALTHKHTQTHTQGALQHTAVRSSVSYQRDTQNTWRHDMGHHFKRTEPIDSLTGSWYTPAVDMAGCFFSFVDLFVDFFSFHFYIQRVKRYKHYTKRLIIKIKKRIE